MRVFVFLSSSCLGPFHLRQTHLQQTVRAYLYINGIKYALLIDQELVEVVGEGGRGESPWALKARAVNVAASDSVSTSESDNFLVVEAAL